MNAEHLIVDVPLFMVQLVLFFSTLCTLAHIAGHLWDVANDDVTMLALHVTHAIAWVTLFKWLSVMGLNFTMSLLFFNIIKMLIYLGFSLCDEESELRKFIKKTKTWLRKR